MSTERSAAVIVVADASVAVQALEQDGEARSVLSANEIHAPHHIDLEVANALRRHEQRRLATTRQLRDALQAWLSLRVERHSAVALLPRMWALRNELTPYDAAYVVLAEFLECPLLTLDRPLARSTAGRRVAQLVAS